MSRKEPVYIAGLSLAAIDKMSKRKVAEAVETNYRKRLDDMMTETGRIHVDLLRVVKLNGALQQENEKLKRTVSMKSAALQATAFLVPKSHEEAARQFARYDAIAHPFPKVVGPDMSGDEQF